MFVCLQGQFSGMCGNFDMVTVNDMTTAGHMEVSNAQAFGNSWALGQVRECNQACYIPIRYQRSRRQV